MTVAIFFLLALSTWRFTHLIVEDAIPFVKRPREWVEQKWPDSNVAYLVGCTYCSSVWVAAAHVGVLYLLPDTPSIPLPVFVVAALSIVASFGESVLDWLDRYGVG
jgi:hypothetical protein